MKQHLQTVEGAGSGTFESMVNKLLDDGYVVKSTCISKREVGTYDEYSLYQAILVKDLDESK